ncbi:hypothetical protein MCG45_16120 [Clostridium perfringens]|uniref:hypothetical protein n=1 Tax=Clostridium perfringens TaxID=1502 RepID=UPI001F06AEC0|nr:hypothetical protein [Clostridium perfringens]MCH1964356.1 hypothetical protein [Clostridium perfringens]
MYLDGKTLEEVISKAKETGNGIIFNFQEIPTYKEAINKYDCPHCGASFGGGTSNVMKRYEVPSDIEYMMGNVGYTWTEDCKCFICGNLYSQHNGC